jgi:RHS repeat-associated protein
VTAAGAARGATPGRLLFQQGEEGLLAELAPGGAVLRSYGWHPDHPYSTYPLFQHAGNEYFYYHNDHLGTPWRVTNKAGVVVWSATDYTAFGTVTVAANAQMVQPWRFAGQYFDAETSLHYNLRRYYEAETGRYVTQDPLGLAAGTNYYAYANHSPGNFIDPTGEIVPFLMCMGMNYLRCVAACVAIDGIIQLIKDPCSLDWDILTDCAKECLWSLIPIPTPCSKWGKMLAGAIGVYGAASDAVEIYDAVSDPGPSTTPAKKNSFVEGTLVATPEGLKSIEMLRPGDLVLSFDEVRGGTRPETVTDIALSNREQKVVTLTLESGQKIEVTGGHPLHTPQGWRAAQLMQAGGQLDIKGKDGALRPAVIVAVSIQNRIVPVYNLEVSHTHSFFVGEDGVLAHNGVRENKEAGDTFRDEVRDVLRENGHNVESEVERGHGIKTPYGMRYPDIYEYGPTGKIIRLFECKRGGAKRSRLQKKKDKWIRRVYGADTIVVGT